MMIFNNIHFTSFNIWIRIREIVHIAIHGRQLDHLKKKSLWKPPFNSHRWCHIFHLLQDSCQDLERKINARNF